MPTSIALLGLHRVLLGTQGRGGIAGRPTLPFAQGIAAHDGEKVVMKARLVFRGDDGNLEVDLGKARRWCPWRIARW